jgi:hypothetical protein
MLQKAVFHGDQPYLYQIIAKNRIATLLRLVLDTGARFGVFSPKVALFKVFAP